MNVSKDTMMALGQLLLTSLYTSRITNACFKIEREEGISQKAALLNMTMADAKEVGAWKKDEDLEVLMAAVLPLIPDLAKDASDTYDAIKKERLTYAKTTLASKDVKKADI